MIRGCLYIEHIDENNCYMHGLMNVDPKFAYIPNWFLNMMIKRVFYVMIGKLSSKEIYENEVINASLEERK